MSKLAEGRVPRAAGWVVVAVALAPLFIRIPGGKLLILQIFGSRWPTPSLDNAVSLLALLIACIGIPLLPAYVRALANRNSLAWGALVLTAYVLALGGISAVATADVYPLLGAIQYALPIAAVVIGYLFRGRWTVAWTKVLSIFVVLNLGLPILTFTYVYFTLARPVLRTTLTITSRYYYALYSLLPTMVLLACLLLLAWTSQRTAGRVAWFSTFAAGLVFYTAWSRAALVCAAIAAAIAGSYLAWLVLRRGQTGWRPQFRACVAICALAIAVPTWGLLGFRNEATVTPRPPAAATEASRPRPAKVNEPPRVDTTPSAEAEAVDEGEDDRVTLLGKSRQNRLRFMQEGLRRWARVPVFGVMFRPDERNEIFGRLVEKKQVFASHNQYVDILLKTGVVGLVLMAGFYMYLVALPLVRMAIKAPLARRPRYGIIVAILAGVVITANFQLYVTVWTTGVPLGFIMGYALAEAELEPEEAAPPAGVEASEYA